MAELKKETPPTESFDKKSLAVTTNQEFTALLTLDHQPSVFQHPTMFEHAQRVARMLVVSSMAPDHFKGEANLGNAVVAVDIAFRLRVSPLLVMNQIYMVYGKPGFSSQFVVATINSSGQFTRLKYKFSGEGEKRACIAWAKELESGEVLEGTKVDVDMARKQGWWGKKDSKWPVMTDQMLAYRAAAFWGRTYAPELLMGLQTIEEIEDVGTATVTRPLFPKKDQPEMTAVVVEELKKSITAEPPPAPEIVDTNPPPPPPPPPVEVPEVPVPPVPPPVQEPPPPPVEEKPKPESAIKLMRKKLAEGGRRPEELLAFLAEIGLVEPLDTLESLLLVHDDVFKAVEKELDDIIKRMNANVKHGNE